MIINKEKFYTNIINKTQTKYNKYYYTEVYGYTYKKVINHYAIYVLHKIKVKKRSYDYDYGDLSCGTYQDLRAYERLQMMIELLNIGKRNNNVN